MKRGWSVLVVVAGLALSQAAEADSSSDGEQLYGQGRDLLMAGKPADALPLLSKSLELLPSPNTELLIAHAYRDLGKKVQALDFYERARKDAQAQIDKGQARYAASVIEARDAAAELIKSVGTVDVQAPPGAIVVVRRASGDEVTLSGGGRAFSEPGDVLITLRSGTQQEKRVTVAAGAVVDVVFGDVVNTIPTKPPLGGPKRHASGSPFGVLTIAGAVAGGVGLVGFGLFAGFGMATKSKYDDLTACADSTCSLNADEREQLRTDGKRVQLAANASLAIGSLLVAGGVILVIIDGLNGPDEPVAGRTVSPILSLGPAGGFGGVSVTF